LGNLHCFKLSEEEAVDLALK